MMDTRNPHSLTERGEFYLCLARAFLTPLEPAAFTGLREALAEDLAELGDTLGYDLGDELTAYRDAIGAVPDHAALLQLYSRLFVAPPRPVHLNTGSYLDGALNGGTVLAMETAYLRCGLERGAHFKDLADHLSVQMEFVAWLYFRQAEALSADGTMPEIRPEHFLHGFAARWAPAFVRDLEDDVRKHHECANPYLPLARILAAAIAHDARAEELPAGELRAQKAIAKARHDRAERGVTAEDMEFIARKLREKGLATDHLAIAPELRDEARGYSRGQPPGPRKGSRHG